MKKLFYLAFVSISLIFFGCTPNNPTNTSNSPYTIDPNAFFTVNFNGTTLTSHSLLFNSYPYYLWGSPIITTFNQGNEVMSLVKFDVLGSSTNSMLSAYNQNHQVQQCDASITLTKQGNATGLYNADTFFHSTITDIAAGNKKYDIDSTNALFTISSVGPDYIIGSFTCNLIDGSTRIPAIGSFRIRRF